LSREVGRSDGKRDFPVGFEWVEEGLWGRLGGGGERHSGRGRVEVEVRVEVGW